MCKKIIELIVPCYNEEGCIEIFYKKVLSLSKEDVFRNYGFIITYVDDGSKDNTIKEIKKIANLTGNCKVQYISLSRNFGKEAAIYAGLCKSRGDYVAVMDADLQHPPELLIKMLYAIEEEGYDCASARRISRKGEPIIRSFFSRAFYHIINKITVIDLVPGATDYRLMKRKVVDAIIAMPEHERFIKGIYAWIGYNNKWIEYENTERVAGKTKWSMRGLLSYAYHGFLAFATTPLRAVIWFGMLVVFLSIVLAIKIYWGTVKTNAPRTGYASIMILILFLGGVIITILGMIGEYLARIYMEVKKRPIYFERESNIDI